jgi:hypothetical protein
MLVVQVGVVVPLVRAGSIALMIVVVVAVRAGLVAVVVVVVVLGV